MNRNTTIRAYFETLRRAWGPQNWWPADSAFEVISGAILTQNAAWTNVELALANLRISSALTTEAIRTLPLEQLERLVRPAGFFRQKASRLKRFVEFLDANYGGELDKMFAQPTDTLRTQLLAINGIGPETADSILLYAGQHEIFVVDAYTRRILERHGVIEPGSMYEEMRAIVESAIRSPHPISAAIAKPLPTPDLDSGPGPAEGTLVPTIHPASKMSEAPRSDLAQAYNEFHALLVQVAKHYCQSRVARCESCPLRLYLTGPVR